jgi:hypothetical protein
LLVLDFVRRTDRRTPAIAVHRFHAGHLGLVPGSSVSVGLPFANSPEVMVTPLHSPQSDLAAISATTKDDVGVVRDLVEVVAGFGFNVEVQESSSIDAHDSHHVHLIVDLSYPEREKTVPPRIRHLYGHWRAHTSTHDLRYIELFTAIVERFGDNLLWRPSLQRDVPQLTVLPLPSRTLRDPDWTEVEKRDTSDQHVFVPLGEAAKAVRRLVRENDPYLHYVYVSDTSQRNLRAYFISSERARKVVHLGFRHPDEPGQLAKILEVVAEAEFTIVTSLLRKHSRPRDASDGSGESLWEAILEYKGRKSGVPEVDLDDPAEDYAKLVLPWARDVLCAAATRVPGITSGEVTVGAPLYPRRYGGSEEAFEPLTWSKRRPRSRPTPGRPPTQLYRDAPKHSEMEALANVVGAYRRRSVRRRMFLSYPERAKELVHKHLEGALTKLKRYDLIVYDEGRGKPQTPEIVRLIRSCDYFVGIWHPDQVVAGEKPVVTLSPWMPFEFGVAFARGVERVLAVHELVPKDIWDRIDKDTGRHRYSDGNFASDLVPGLIKFCREEFP